MPKPSPPIPVNDFSDEYGYGISIEKLFIDKLPQSEEAQRAHRHDRHTFFLVESGTIQLEIDFERYRIKGPAVAYVHPDQVHISTNAKDLSLVAWAMKDENLQPHYLNLLKDSTPAKPLPLKKAAFQLLAQAAGFCLELSARKIDQLYYPLLKDGCNALTALVIAHYTTKEAMTGQTSRSGLVARSFHRLLEQYYITEKRPAFYAQQLNISIPYLNECVKKTTGFSVSHHIQQRIVLEAKRLLHHTDQSVKEIAAALGYDDYPYFSRLFTKTAGTTALAFRNKNLV